MPRLTTTDMNDVPKEFTDGQVQWDVDTEIEVGWNYPHHTMSYEENHLPAETCYYSYIYTPEYGALHPCFQDGHSREDT